MEHRRFHRITYTAPGLFSCNNLTHEGRLGNISLQGAMFSANEGVMVSPGDRCTLTIRDESLEAPLLMYAEVVHAFYSMVGVKFHANREEEELLYDLLKGLTPDPALLQHEWEHVLHNESNDGENAA